MSASPIIEIHVECHGVYKRTGVLRRPIGAAAAVVRSVAGEYIKHSAVIIPHTDRPSLERAELIAFIHALEKALDMFTKQEPLEPEPPLPPKLRLDIYSYSGISPKCLEEDVNGIPLTDPRRRLIVVGQDVVEKVERVGEMRWTVVNETHTADQYCKEAIAKYKKGEWEGPLSSNFEFARIALR